MPEWGFLEATNCPAWGRSRGILPTLVKLARQSDQTVGTRSGQEELGGLANALQAEWGASQGRGAGVADPPGSVAPGLHACACGMVPGVSAVANDGRWRPWLRLGELHGFNAAHAVRVTRFALALFADLGPAFGLGETDGWLLGRGALLHDVARGAGARQHHKRGAQIIRRADVPGDDRERRLVALLVRYHRKALPSLAHEEFAILRSSDQFRVKLLAGILRVADGLEDLEPAFLTCLCCRLETGVVRILACHADPDGWAPGDEVPKRDLLERVIGRAVVLSACAQNGEG